MDLGLDANLLDKYANKRHLGKLLSESWVEHNLYCPNCLEPKLKPEPPNTELTDFRCVNGSCGQTFQLKAHKGKIGSTWRDSAYNPWIVSFEQGTTPNVALMQYNISSLSVVNLEVIPPFFIRPSCIRKWELSTRPNYWMCTLLLDSVGPDARVKIVTNGIEEAQQSVHERYRSFAWMRQLPYEKRGWTADVLRCVRELGKKRFTLKEIYATYEKELEKLHPENKNVQPKIRQQLQVLRKQGKIRFLERGRYEFV
jgi:type II restriction enzyme